jgi:ZIP family zinc transporter
MNEIWQCIIGILIPFLGTSLGAAVVFMFKNEVNSKLQKMLVGFAAGVMFAAAIWSLIIPAIEMADAQGKIGWIAATIGILLGTFFLMFTDIWAEKIIQKSKKNVNKKTGMLNFAITLHNIPEGMAVRDSTSFKFDWEFWSGIYVCFSIINWNCDSKFSRGNGNFFTI